MNFNQYLSYKESAEVQNPNGTFNSTNLIADGIKELLEALKLLKGYQQADPSITQELSDLLMKLNDLYQKMPGKKWSAFGGSIKLT